MKKISTEEFIKRAKEVHGSKYDYSKVNYINSNTKIIIICPIHGEFEQFPLNHLKGYGCKLCGHILTNNKQKSNTNEFVEKARNIHGNKYDYSKVDYINNHTKVCIICPIHGEFWMTPGKHLQGQDCPKCVVGGKLTTEEFIRRARAIHGDKYDYSKVNYIDSRLKVTLICPIHGEFEITAHSHLQGRGCQECGQNRRRNAKRMTKEQFIEKAKKIHGDKYDYSKVEYTNNYTKVCIICNKCGHEFYQEPRQHLSRCGCSYCKFSKLEILCENVLKENNIQYSAQYPLSKQFLDFYLPQYNIVVECQGKQHFNGLDFFGVSLENREEAFNKNLERDIRKYNKCREQGIKVLYFTKKEWLPKDIFENPLFEGIYTEENTFIDIDELLKEI